MTLRLPLGKERYLSLVNVYALTLSYTDEEKEAFYHQLTEVVKKVQKEEKLFILGNFNARVGTDCDIHADVLGKFGKGRKNSNGDLLLNFCTQHELCITNNFFYQLDKNFFTWTHARTGGYHLLDYVVTRKSHLRDIL